MIRDIRKDYIAHQATCRKLESKPLGDKKAYRHMEENDVFNLFASCLERHIDNAMNY